MASASIACRHFEGGTACALTPTAHHTARPPHRLASEGPDGSADGDQDHQTLRRLARTLGTGGQLEYCVLDRLDPGHVAPCAPVPVTTSALARVVGGRGAPAPRPRRNRVVRAWGTFPNCAGPPALPPEPGRPIQAGVIFTLRRASQRQPRQAVKILSKSASRARCPAPVATPGTHLRRGDGAALRRPRQGRRPPRL